MNQNPKIDLLMSIIFSEEENVSVEFSVKGMHTMGDAFRLVEVMGKAGESIINQMKAHMPQEVQQVLALELEAPEEVLNYMNSTPLNFNLSKI